MMYWKLQATKFNFLKIYKPGLVGGHCISVDPYYPQAHKASQLGYLTLRLSLVVEELTTTLWLSLLLQRF